MAYPALSIIEAKVHYIVNGQTCMNVFHYSPFSNGGGAEIIELVDDFLEGFTNGAPGSIPAAMSAVQSNTTGIHLCTAQLIHPVRYIMRSKETTFSGAVDSIVSRQNTGFCVTKTGVVATRANVSTSHFGGVPDSNFGQGEIDAGWLPQWKALAAAIGEDVTGANIPVTYNPCILNKEKIPDSDPVKYRIKGYTLITQTFLQTTARTMRRRTVGQGI